MHHENSDKNTTCANWLGRQGSNLRMTASKAVALPLGDAPLVMCGAEHKAYCTQLQGPVCLFLIALKFLRWATDDAL